MPTTSRQASNDGFSRRTASDVLSVRSSALHCSRGHGMNDNANCRWGAGPFDAGEEEAGAVTQQRQVAAMSRTFSARIATEPLMNVVLSDLRRPALLGFGPSPGTTPSPSPIPEEASASPFSQAGQNGDSDMMEMDASYESSISADIPPQLFTGKEIYGESAERWRVLGRCWNDHLIHCKEGQKGRLCFDASLSGFD